KTPRRPGVGSIYFKEGKTLHSIWKRTIVMVLVIGLALSSIACTTDSGTKNDDGLQITDQLGRTVVFDEIPERIISISPANTEILFALDLGDKIIGVTNYCNYPEETADKEKVGGFSTPDIEKIIALNPDVIFAAPIHEAEIIPQLENLGLTVVALTPATIEETYDAIELAGIVTGVQDTADSLIEDMRSSVDVVSGLVANLSDQEKPNVFYIVWHDPLMTAGGDTLPGQLIELAGGNNMFANESDYPTVSIESLLFGEPQVIIAGSGHGSGASASLVWAQTESRLQGTEALVNGMVFEISSDLTSRFGPRIVDGLYEMFELIHPELADELE
ncbi:MAG: ABC transporter substrate-binding protein, partial [Dehalococcoidia bacterium]